MLFSLAVCLEGVIIVLPAIAGALSWSATPRFYRTHPVSIFQKRSYVAGLVVVSLSTLAYLGYLPGGYALYIK